MPDAPAASRRAAWRARQSRRRQSRTRTPQAPGRQAPGRRRRAPRRRRGRGRRGPGWRTAAGWPAADSRPECCPVSCRPCPAASRPAGWPARGSAALQPRCHSARGPAPGPAAAGAPVRRAAVLLSDGMQAAAPLLGRLHDGSASTAYSPQVSSPSSSPKHMSSTLSLLGARALCRRACVAGPLACVAGPRAGRASSGGSGMPSGAGTGRPPGARGSAGRPPAAAPADTKRDECAPPSANARLSNTCARRARARAQAIPPPPAHRVPAACPCSQAWAAAGGAGARAVEGRASCTSDGLSADSGPSTRQRCSLKWPSSAFHSGCLLSTCARCRALAAAAQLPRPRCRRLRGASAAAQTLARQ